MQKKKTVYFWIKKPLALNGLRCQIDWPIIIYTIIHIKIEMSTHVNLENLARTSQSLPKQVSVKFYKQFTGNILESE
jgi:hypothetical protein